MMKHILSSLILLSLSFSVAARLNRRLQDGESDGFNILALGGSVTWGAALESRQHAWPFQMENFGPHKVTNHALRATGSFYPGLCIQSMLEGDTTEYDVIALEFSINGAQAFDWLVKRLRARFPNAIIIYVHLYALKSNVMDELGKTPNDHGWTGDLENRGLGWYWKNGRPVIKEVAPQVKAAEKYGMYYYYFPIPDSPSEAFQWYGLDAHHLSPMGHGMVAKRVLAIAEGIMPPVKKEAPGTWGLGDYCDNWFSNGDIKLQYTGATLNALDGSKFKDKFTLEFGEEGGSIVLPNNGPRAPLWAHYMSGHVMYPQTDVTIWNREYVLEPNNDEAFYHTVKTQLLGYAESSPTNEILFKPRSGYGTPFRLVAIGYCGACYEDVIGGPDSMLST